MSGLLEYQDKLVRVTDSRGNTFTGVADTLSSDCGLRDFSRGEESVEIGDHRLFESDIAKIERLPTLEEAQSSIPLGRYRHFKGREYEVLAIARHSETEEVMVVYRALYGERGIWVRPAVMWNETITRDGRTFRRFEWVD